MTAAIIAGILVAAGVYLICQRGLVRVTFGFVLLGHAANVILVAAGGMAWRDAPLLGAGETSEMADPLPQAFVLTAIVITFGITVYLLGLSRAGGEDDSEPRSAAGPETEPEGGPEPEPGAEPETEPFRETDPERDPPPPAASHPQPGPDPGRTPQERG